jgi:hypothetical protein
VGEIAAGIAIALAGAGVYVVATYALDWLEFGAAGRHFPPPWRADKVACGYVVRDTNGQALVWIYSRDNDAEALQARVLTKDEARRIAVNVARLPQLLGKAD